MFESNLYKNYILLSSYELIDLRLRLNITTMTADNLFDLPKGSYASFENGYKIQTAQQDNIIRMTQCFDKCGRNILPTRMLIKG